MMSVLCKAEILISNSESEDGCEEEDKRVMRNYTLEAKGKREGERERKRVCEREEG